VTGLFPGESGMEWVFLIVFFTALVVFFLIRRKERMAGAQQQVDLALEEKKKWNQQKFISFSEVQKIRSDLVNHLNQQLKVSEKQRLLVEIINEWAELKIKTFEDRRSWVRKPGESESNKD
jgi:hypothetical protein